MYTDSELSYIAGVFDSIALIMMKSTNFKTLIYPRFDIIIYIKSQSSDFLYDLWAKIRCGSITTVKKSASPSNPHMLTIMGEEATQLLKVLRPYTHDSLMKYLLAEEFEELIVSYDPQTEVGFYKLKELSEMFKLAQKSKYQKDLNVREFFNQRFNLTSQIQSSLALQILQSVK